MRFTGCSQQVRSVFIMWTLTMGHNPKLLQITWAIVVRLYSDLNLKKSLPPSSAIFNCSWPMMITFVSVSLPNGTEIKKFSIFPLLHLYLYLNFQRIMGCRRVISIRLTSCELTNWCFGPTTTTAADFRIICAAQVCVRQRLKQPVSIWLSLKCESIHLEPKTKKKRR